MTGFPPSLSRPHKTQDFSLLLLHTLENLEERKKRAEHQTAAQTTPEASDVVARVCREPFLLALVPLISRMKFSLSLSLVLSKDER